MLTENDLKKIKKLLAQLATKRDIDGARNLASLCEKYAAVKIKLGQHERLIKDLQKKSFSKDSRSELAEIRETYKKLLKKKGDVCPQPIMDMKDYAFTAKNPRDEKK